MPQMQRRGIWFSVERIGTGGLAFKYLKDRYWGFGSGLARRAVGSLRSSAQECRLMFGSDNGLGGTDGFQVLNCFA